MLTEPGAREAHRSFAANPTGPTECANQVLREREVWGRAGNLPSPIKSGSPVSTTSSLLFCHRLLTGKFQSVRQRIPPVYVTGKCLQPLVFGVTPSPQGKQALTWVSSLRRGWGGVGRGSGTSSFLGSFFFLLLFHRQPWCFSLC